MCAVTTQRTRADRCPGVTRPWPAEDGPLVRVRVPGGRLSGVQWRALGEASQAYADGWVHLTSRANVQVRSVRDLDAFAAALEAAGLLPSRRHDLVRNVMCSPLTGLSGGRADLRPVLAELDRLMLADERLAGLPGKFLVALDDGRGDVAGGEHDLGCLAVDAGHARILINGRGGSLVTLSEVADAIVGLQHAFLDVRENAWHVGELRVDQQNLGLRLSAIQLPTYTPPPFGDVVAGVFHLEVDGGAARAETLTCTTVDEVVITPWRSLLLRTCLLEHQEIR